MIASSASSVGTQQVMPTAARIASACSRCCADTLALANSALAPQPSRAGVLGMQRTMAACGPSRACMLVMVTPAAIEITSARLARTARAMLLVASAITCGLTAMITTSALAAAVALSAQTLTGAISRSRSRLAG